MGAGSGPILPPCLKNGDRATPPGVPGPEPVRAWASLSPLSQANEEAQGPLDVDAHDGCGYCLFRMATPEGKTLAKESVLYYGDNLDVLRRYVPDESVDLVYLDPPFNSAQDYNVLFQERDGERAAAQIKAFGDTWTWDQEASSQFHEIVERGGRVSEAMQAFRTFLGENDMLAYLSMMAPRLVELRRVLKSTGSIYLHCDPTASHYLKMLMDAVFGPQLFLNEIIWRRTASHSAAKRYGPVHDVILFYARSSAYGWNTLLTEHTDEYKSRYTHKNPDGSLWSDDNLTAPGVRNGDSGAEWRGLDPTPRGFHWKVSSKAVEGLIGKDKAKLLGTREKLDVLDEHGLIHWPQNRAGTAAGFPRFKRVLSEGAPVQDVVTDIPPINSQAQERLGYRPEARSATRTHHQGQQQ